MNIARIVLSVLFITCMVWLWYPYFTQVNTVAKADSEVIAKPDYTAIELKQTAFDENGEISHKVTAVKTELYEQLGFNATHYAQRTARYYNWTEFKDHR